MVCGSAREIPEKAVFRQVDRLREPCCHHSRIHMDHAESVRAARESGAITHVPYPLFVSRAPTRQLGQQILSLYRMQHAVIIV